MSLLCTGTIVVSTQPLMTSNGRRACHAPMQTQIATLVVGLLLTAATGLATWYGMRAFEKHLKRH